MKKLADFIVNKRFVILSVMLIVTIVSAILIPHVTINRDMTKYLSDSSPMKQGLAIMEDEFPETETANSIRVMFTDLNDEQKADIYEKLQKIDNVDGVTYDESQNYNNGNYTLYVLQMSCEYGSVQEKAIFKALDKDFSEYSLYYVNDDNEAETSIPVWVIIVALVILITVLLFMCGSYFEPLLFLAVIAMAIVINLGTNIMFGSISSVTFSIAAILQLVLSMDYSIILMNRYRQERRLTEDKTAAMKSALRNSFSSIASSAFTTIVGLFMLVFMSFSIGMDLGLVLAKGVLLSCLTVFSVLPCLILLSDKIILKTEKKHGKIQPQVDTEKTQTNALKKKSRFDFSQSMTKFSFKGRYAIAAFFIFLFAGVCVLQAFTPVTYTQNTTDPIAEVFPVENTIVMIYDNQDEQTVNRLSEKWKDNENIISISSYNVILGKPYKATELEYTLGEAGGGFAIDEQFIKVIYYDKFDGTLYSVGAGTFLNFVYNLAQNESVATIIPAEMQRQFEMLYEFSDKDNLIVPLPCSVLAEIFQMEENQVSAILQAGQKGESASISEFINIAAEMAKNPQAGVDETTAASLISAQTIVNAVVSGSEYSVSEMSEILSLDENITQLLYLLYAGNLYYNDDWELSLHDFVNHVYEMANGSLAALLDEDIKATVAEMKTQLDDGAAQLKGETYSRVILSTTYPAESEETTAFFNELTAELDGQMQFSYYLIGNSAMNYEMGQSFDKELLLITLLTIAAIFIVVALSFRNLLIPAILVLLVQCGVYITVSVLHFVGVYFLALLIVECILMGATIDYGILFTNYYREYRAAVPPSEALKKAYEGSIHTILTSGLILILVTGIIGLLTSGTMSQICLAIAIGTLSAAAMILLVLPSLLLIFDKAIVRRIGRLKKKNNAPINGIQK